MSITSNAVGATDALSRLKLSMTPARLDPVISRVAFIVHRRMVLRTPKKWTGMTRRSWRVNRYGQAKYNVTNRSKVMNYLEYGTKAHGAKRANYLFIPLTRKAALAGARTVMQANASAAEGGGRPPYVAGRDFIFKKRVKGIKAMRIVRDYLPLVDNLLNAAVRQYIRKEISNVS